MNTQASGFTQMLLEANDMDPGAFQCWVFHPGMLFGSTDKWWGDYTFRTLPHEGIDFCLFKNRSGDIRRFSQGTRIPVMHTGTIKAILRDFLGHAVIMEYKNGPVAAPPYFSVYAHTRPREDLTPGTVVQKGDIIATIADTRQSKANILPHLHFTFGRPSPQFIYTQFDWNRLHDPERVTLLDPLSLLDWPYQEGPSGRALTDPPPMLARLESSDSTITA